MNKNIIKSILSATAVALMCWGCETNYYNENYLDDYENNGEIVDVHTVDLTLDKDHYSAISKNSTNKSIAEAAGEDAVAALSAVAKNQYFASADDAATYIPAYLSQLYPTFDNGSVAMVTYTAAVNVPENVQKLNAATTFDFKDKNYQAVWGNEKRYAAAFTPATVGSITQFIPTEGLEAGDYVFVTYDYSEAEPDFEAEEEAVKEANKPVITFPGAGKYLFVANVGGVDYAATPLGADKSYGYLGRTEVTIAADQIAANDTTNALAWTVAAMDGGYSICGADGRFIYMKGTYNSFNLSNEVGAEGYAYTFTPNEDGTFAIVNATMNKSLQLDTQYNTWGAYPDIRGAVPAVYVLNDAGTAYVNVTTLSAGNEPAYVKVSKFEGAGKYIIAASDENGFYPALPIAADKTYGYLNPGTVTVKGGVIVDDEDAAAVVWTVEATANANEFALKGADGRYHYMKGTYNSFNVSADLGTEGYGYTFAVNADGTFTITNATTSKWMQYDTQYNSYGAYNTQKGLLPSLYKHNGVVTEEPTIKPKVDSKKVYVLYKWNGSSFEKDNNVLTLQPADYAEMGQGKYNNFTSPAQDNYLPLFLAQKYPYALEGDEVYVGFRCYAGGATNFAVDHYTFGTEWSKVSYFETKTDQFRKAEGVWNIDRTLELNFPNGDAGAKAFYQYCVNWVYDNKDVALGAPARDNAGVIVATDIVTISGAKPTGDYWVSNYGNNEFYTGASAYYGNMDWRVSAVKGGFTAAGMGDLTDDQITAKLKEHTAEVFAAVLGYAYPTMTPEEYKKVVINFYAYGPNATYTCAFAVTGTGTFEYVADSMAEL